mmetsp:Transcript_13666/g.33518  ORF Transcript_13666/g.33518 Transcript_13666/m.33518 type:complete len:221 (-) Transcript_13666:108-770(-)
MSLRCAMSPSASTQMVTGPGRPSTCACDPSSMRAPRIVTRRHPWMTTWERHAGRPSRSRAQSAQSLSEIGACAVHAAGGCTPNSSSAELLIRLLRTWSSPTRTSSLMRVRPRTKARPLSSSLPKPYTRKRCPLMTTSRPYQDGCRRCSGASCSHASFSARLKGRLLSPSSASIPLSVMCTHPLRLRVRVCRSLPAICASARSVTRLAKGERSTSRHTVTL